jgi:hypothetical protein
MRLIRGGCATHCSAKGPEEAGSSEGYAISHRITGGSLLSASGLDISLNVATPGSACLTHYPPASPASPLSPPGYGFVASAPNRCWVADFTHVAAWSGVVYVAFVVDTFSRRIVGWSASASKETQLVLGAPEMALWQRDRESA